MTLEDVLDRLAQDRDALCRVPVSTYRLQLNRDLTFDDAAELIPYLASLGITDAYTSPFFETASGSLHGYDVSDHNRLRSDIGGAEGFARLAEALKRHGLGLLIDVVPNHMGIAGVRNAWFADVLEHGPRSRYAPFFDIDWTPVKRELAGKVLLPILGDQYGAILESGQLRLELHDGVFSVLYHETSLPIAPRTYARVLGHGLDRLQAKLGGEQKDLLQLKSLIAWFVTLPGPTETEPERRPAGSEEAAAGKRQLAELLAASAAVREFVEDNVRLFNGRPGEPKSFDLLDALLGDQAYRLAYWRVAGEEINYRRFFDVDQLAAIRMEDPAVFEETHRLIRRLVRDAIATGLRIDHPDGLYAPGQYFERLQRACFLETIRRQGDAQPSLSDEEVLRRYDRLVAEDDRLPRPCYVVVEKILAAGEPLPARWAVSGTTGYEFLNLLNGIFVDRVQARAMEDIYARLVRSRASFPEIVYEAKRLILETSMASELNVLGHRLNIISEKHRSSRDFTLGNLIQALREVIACFPVYRTYFGESGGEASDRDREAVTRAVALARRRTPGIDPSVYDWLEGVLTLRFPDWADESARRERIDFVKRFQQMTGPVMAKGYEDTALYRYYRLVSLNEVGGDPSRFGTPVAEFHAAMTERQQKWAAGLSATSTHDTKRSEDVRARINMLSEIPHEWRARVGRWHRLNSRHRATVEGQIVPGPDEEYFIYQTLVGAWPISAERLRAYLLKAVHEAKVHTSWTNPNTRYDEAIVAFADTILDPRRSRQFLRDVTAFQARVASFGRLNSLAQVLVKITAPGVPDFYQGTELWDLSLVDPDNRRPVDWAERRRLLDALARDVDTTTDRAALARALVDEAPDGRVKMYLIREALAFRRSHAALFLHGEYRPLDATGPFAEHVCAFARIHGDEAALAVVPRLLARRGLDVPPLGREYWEQTAVAVPGEPGARFRNVLTDERLTAAAPDSQVALGQLPMGDVLRHFPVALLERLS